MKLLSNKVYLPLVAVLSVLCSATSRAEVLYPYLFLGIEQLSENVENYCPVAKCVVVGIGRSPSPIIAFLQTKYEGRSYAFNLPLTKFRYGIADLPRLNSVQETNLFNHFDVYFPSPAELNGRSVLLVDYSVSGESLVAAYTYLGKYLTDRQAVRFAHHLPQLDMLAITDPTSEEIGLHHYVRNRIVVDEKGVMLRLHTGDIHFPQTSLINQQFAHGYFDNLSAFGAFDIKSDVVDTRRRRPGSGYIDLKREIRKFLNFPDLVTTDSTATLFDHTTITSIHQADFDSDIWLKPQSPIESKRLAEQIKWGMPSEQEIYYTQIHTNLTTGNDSLVESSAIHNLIRYRGQNPSRGTLFLLALNSSEAEIRKTAVETFYLLGQSNERTAQETSFVLEMTSAVLRTRPELLRDLVSILNYADVDRSVVDVLYSIYQPTFQSADDDLTSRALVEIKKLSTTFRWEPVRDALLEKLHIELGVVIE